MMAVRWCRIFLLLGVVIGSDSTSTGFVRQPYHHSDKIIFPGDLPYPFVQLDSEAVQKLQNQHQHAIEVILGVAMRLKRLIDGEEAIRQQNFLVSPVSVAAALGQLLVGSRGTLRQHLIDVLQIKHLENRTAAPYDFIKFHSELGSLLRYLDNHPGQDRYTLKAASIVFIDHALKDNINVDYKHVLQSVYGTEIRPLNFSGDPAGSMRTINDWGSTNTAGLIPQMLSEPPPPYTVSLMTNAVYFKGIWQVPFSTRNTLVGKFRVSRGKTVDVQMMNGDLEVKYAEDHELGVRMIILPYKDYQTAMYLIQPLNNNQLDLEPILQNMTVKNVAKVMNQTELQTVSVSLPRLKLKSSLSLRKPLLHYREIYLGDVTTLPPPAANYDFFKPGEIYPSYNPSEQSDVENHKISGMNPPVQSRPSYSPELGEVPKNASVSVEYNTNSQYPPQLPVIVIGGTTTSTERAPIPLNHALPINNYKRRGHLGNRRARQSYSAVVKQRKSTSSVTRPCFHNLNFGETYGAQNTDQYMTQIVRNRDGEEQTSQTGSVVGQLGSAASQFGEQANQAGQVAGQLGQHSSNFGNAAGQIGTSSQNIGSSAQQIGSNPVTLPQNAGAIAQNLGQIGQGVGQLGQTTGEVAQMGGQGALGASQMVQEGLTQSPPIKFSDRFGDSVENNFDMSGASNDPRFRIDDIIHQMSLEINEMGTEAAAVTVSTVDYMGGGLRFIADRPFIFLIRHEPTSASLFWGSIINPLE